MYVFYISAKGWITLLYYNKQIDTKDNYVFMLNLKFLALNWTCKSYDE